MIQGDSDEGTGSGDVQIFVNDPPTFASVFDASQLYPPYENVTFWAIIADVDNSSNELNVTLWYSNDSWVTHNESIPMIYNDTVSADNYRFIYEFEGERQGTYYDYYYTGFDGEHNITDDNSGLYYDIDWGVLGVYPGSSMFDPYHPANLVNKRATDLWNQFPVIFLSLVIVVGMVTLIRKATKG